MTHKTIEEIIEEFDLKFSTLVAEHSDGTTTRKGVSYEMLDYLRQTLTQYRADQDKISRAQERVAVLNEAIQVSEECERGQHTEFDEWRAFKCFRNTLRSRLTAQNNNTV